MLATTALPTAGPMETQQLLAAFEKSSSEAVGRAFVAALLQSKTSSSLSAATLRTAVGKFPAGVMHAAEPLLQAARRRRRPAEARLAELAPLLIGGDASRGQAVFLGKTAGCTTCHTIGGAGGHVGPDLSKIGAMRSGRDLLESIIYPSSSIARGFEPFIVETRDGQAYAGTLAGESTDAIRLKTPAEVVIPPSQIKNFRPDRVSIMPQGLESPIVEAGTGGPARVPAGMQVGRTHVIPRGAMRPEGSAEWENGSTPRSLRSHSSLRDDIAWLRAV